MVLELCIFVMTSGKFKDAWGTQRDSPHQEPPIHDRFGFREYLLEKSWKELKDLSHT